MSPSNRLIAVKSTEYIHAPKRKNHFFFCHVMSFLVASSGKNVLITYKISTPQINLAFWKLWLYVHDHQDKPFLSFWHYVMYILICGEYNVSISIWQTEVIIVLDEFFFTVLDEFLLTINEEN